MQVHVQGQVQGCLELILKKGKGRFIRKWIRCQLLLVAKGGDTVVGRGGGDGDMTVLVIVMLSFQAVNAHLQLLFRQCRSSQLVWEGVARLRVSEGG